MLLEEKKAVAIEFYRVFDQQDIERGRELIAPDIVARGLTAEPLEGIEAVMGYGALMFAAFPDGKHVIEDAIAEGDRVVTKGTFSGTHRGELMGMPATGKAVSFSVIHIDRIVDGKVVEHWGQGDTPALMSQLGAVTLPGPRLLASISKGLLSKMFRSRDR